MAYTPEQLYELYKGGIPIADAPSAPPAPTPDINNVGDLSSQFQGATGYDPVDAAGYAATGHVNTGVGQGGYRENSLPGKLDPMPTRDEMGLETPTEGQQAYSMGTKQGFGYGASASAGHTGINFDTLAKLDKQDKPLFARQAASRQAVQTEFDPVMAAHDQARNSGKAAVDAQIDADMAKLTDEQAAARYMGNLNQSIVNEDMKILARETATKNKLMSEYSAALADFAASKVDPNDLWHGMSGGMRFGTMVTAFVHDFLGAKNIKTSAMDTFKGAIDRNINAQIQNINKKGEVARGFKTLYDMESARSSSAEETRARIRGYMLEAAKNHVVANMSQYKSLLATAEGRKALAKLDEEYAKNYMEVNKFVEQAGTARAAQDQQWVQHKAQLSVEQYKASIAAKTQRLEQQKFDAAQKAAKDKAAAEMAMGRILDPESNKYTLQFRGDVVTHKDELAKVNEKASDMANLNDQFKELKRLAAKAGGGTIANDIAGINRLDDQDKRNYEAIRSKVAHYMAKITDGRVSDQDVKDYLKSIPISTALTNGGIDQILNWTHKSGLEEANHYIRQWTVDIPKELQTSGPQGRLYADTSKVVNLEHDATKREGGPTVIDNAQKLLGGPDGKLNSDYLEKSGYDEQDVKLDFFSNTGARTTKKAYNVLGGIDYTRDVPKDPPAWAGGIFLLGEAARKGGANGDQAREYLTKLSTLTYADAQKDPALKDYDYETFGLMKKYAQTKVLNFKPKTFKGKSTMDSSNEGVDFSAGQGPLGTNPTDIN